MKLKLNIFYIDYNLIIKSTVHELAALASPRKLLEMCNYRPCPKPTETKCLFLQSSEV